MALGTSWTQIASDGFTYLGYSGTAYVYAKLNRQDVANNKSYVDLQLRINHSVWVQSYDTDFYLSGYGWLGYAYRSFDAGTTTIMSSQITINHNANGTGSFTATGGYEYKGIGISATQFTSSSQSLPTIPRASVPSINTYPNNSPNFTLGDTITIHMNRKSTSFTHTVKFKYGNTSVTVGTGITNNVQFDTSTVENAILALIPTSQSYSNVVEVTTYNGSTVIGTKTCSYTAKINTAVEHPVVGTITISDINARTSAVTQDDSIYIANISTLEATIPFAVAGTHTVLSEATVTCGNVTQDFVLSGTTDSITFTFDKVNVSSLTVTAKDGRGTTVTSTKTWTLIQYQPVTAVATVGRPSATGSVGVGQLTGMAYGGNFGATQNSLNITIDFKKHDDTDYDPTGTETDTLALTQDGYNSYSDAFTFAYTLDYQYQYDIRFTVSDLFSTATYVAQLMQGLPILSWDETEVDVWGNLHIHDREEPYKYQDVMDGFDALMTNQKNVLAVMPSSNPLTTAGITFNRVIEHRVTQYININGTATGRAFYRVCENFTLESGRNYVLSGFHDNWVEGAAVVVRLQATETNICTAYQDDEVFEAPNEAIMVYLYVPTGTVMDNVKYYPMIRDARIASETYIPYRPLASRWMLATQRFNSSSVTIAAGASGSVNINTSNWQEGRVPLCILRTWSNGNIIISYSNSASASNLTSVTVWYRNVTSSSTTVYFTVEMLFIDARFMI